MTVRKSLAALVASLGMTLTMTGAVIASPTQAANSAFESGIEAYRTGDIAGAVGDWEKASDGGHPMAAYLLGQLYEQGRGVEQSAATSFHYYQVAAAAGQAQAGVKVGLIYRDGNKALGIKRNYEKALENFEKGAAESWPESQYYLADMYRRGLGTPANRSESMRWLILASKKHHAPSLLELARIHFEGEGVNPDRVLGWSYIELASRFADQAEGKRVNDAMDKYGKRMKAGEKDEAKSIADEWMTKYGAS
ncbi:MAG: tetratricopeptide repeat protein [Parvibaculum sp.]|uniref:tetratricopeptide repeat protein n=1 Tax=Parvibaculum sp. TaxID=2024848 RepID=UPI003C788165